MNKTLGIILITLGVSSFLFGSYISHQVTQKEVELTQDGEHWRRQPVVGPVRRGAAAQANATKQQRLNQGWQQVLQSETTAYWLQGIGLVLTTAGLVTYFYRPKRGH